MNHLRADYTYRLGKLVYDQRRNLLLDTNGKIAHLRNQTSQVLDLLVEHRNTVVRRDTIFETLWSDRYVTDDSLTHCITEIRRAIGDSKRQILVTVHRSGYRLLCEPVDAQAETELPPRFDERQDLDSPGLDKADLANRPHRHNSAAGGHRIEHPLHLVSATMIKPTQSPCVPYEYSARLDYVASR